MQRFRFVRSLTRASLVAVAGAALALVPLGSASATERSVDNDDVKISASGFDFGGYEAVVGELLLPGQVSWWVDENDTSPRLTGYLHLRNVDGECARMRMDYYTGAGTYLTTRYGTTWCATEDGLQRQSIDLGGYTSSRIGKVRVRLEHRLSNNSWVGVGDDQWSTLHDFFSHVHMARMSDHSFSFGGTGWDGLYSQAGGHGEVRWDFEDGRITPRLTGALHINHAPGACARMRIKYYADDGPDAGSDDELLHTVHGGTVCLNENIREYWNVDLAGYSSDLIDNVLISIQKLEDGEWLTENLASARFGHTVASDWVATGLE